MSYRFILLLAWLCWPVIANSTAVEQLLDHSFKVADAQAEVTQLRASRNAKEWRSPLDQARLLIAISRRLEVLSELDEAYAGYSEAIALLESIELSPELVTAYLDRSYINYLKSGKAEQFCPDRKQAVGYARQLGDADVMAQALTQQAFCYQGAGGLATGLGLLEEALEIAQTAHLSPRRRGMIYNATGLLYRSNRIHHRAYQNLYKAYLAWAQVDDRQDMFNMLHNLVGESVALGSWQQAQQHVDQMLQLADTSPQFPDFHFFAFFNSGRSALAQNQATRAVTEFERALALADTTAERGFVGAARLGLALALAEQGLLEEAVTAVAALTTSELETPDQLNAQAITAVGRGDASAVYQALNELIRYNEARYQLGISARSQLEVARHDDRIQQFENQVLQQTLAITRLELSSQRDQRRISQLSLALFALLSLLLAAALGYLLHSRQRFKRHAQVDFLTGVANRRHVMERGEELLQEARQNGAELSLILLDIDHFKQINDRFGHEAGDLVLKALMVEASSALRQQEMLGRIGGEEFIILLPQTSLQEAVVIAERLRQAVAGAEFQAPDATVQLTLSLGVATCTRDSADLDSVIKQADDALYQAKAQGRNRVVPAAQG